MLDAERLTAIRTLRKPLAKWVFNEYSKGMMQDDIHQLQQENAALQKENAMLRALVAELLPLTE